MRKIILFSLLMISLWAEEEARTFTVLLKDPTFQNGVLTTDQGGVITGEGMRVQAQKISYTNITENGVKIEKIEAQGDLMIEYGRRYFVGDRLEYDLISKTGTLYNGKTFVDLWYMGGQKIELKADQSFSVIGAFITTSDSQNSYWDIHTGKVKITKDRLFSSKGVRFRFFKIPLFWLPSLKMNLKFLSDPPIRYKVDWDKGQGPRVSMRYRIYSWDLLSVYFRLDYRLKRGFGAAIESDYLTEDKRMLAQTKSYCAYDTSIQQPNTEKIRYRYQGFMSYESIDEKTTMRLSYDKISDRFMPEDFKSVDFEVNSAKRTYVVFRHETPQWINGFNFRPRINNFQGFKQELPTLISTLRPLELGNTGIISTNRIKAAFLEYTYSFFADDLLPNFHAGRAEMKNQLYRPFHLDPFLFTPSIGFTGIYYTSNPQHAAVGQAILSYGGTLSTTFYKHYGRHRHGVEPYAQYEGLTKPQHTSHQVYIFDINDGYHKLNLLKLGVRNTLFSSKHPSFTPKLLCDLYTYGFFDTSIYRDLFPKAFATMEVHMPRLKILSTAAWNFEEKLLDVSNIRTDWTINQDFAFGLEFRHRSRYYWRKDNEESFIVDVTRPIEELRHSPLSDQRNVALARVAMRLAPQWTIHAQAHYGWGRVTEPSYFESKVDLITMLTSSWRARLTYQHTVDDDRVTGAIALVKH